METPWPQGRGPPGTSGNCPPATAAQAWAEHGTLPAGKKKRERLVSIVADNSLDDPFGLTWFL